jgi:hypothetical protein
MYRSRSAISYDILHGLDISPNKSTMFAYLSYFPPPPPIMPGPPPQRSWTCSAQSLSSSSCFISDDLNPSSLRQYIPIIQTNQSFLSTNTSHISNSTHQNLKSLSLLDFFQNQLTFILLLIIFLSISFFVILLLLLFLYIQRLRRRQLRSNRHIETNNNNNNLELNNNTKNQKFYYRLMPYRQKHRKRAISLRNPPEANNILRLSNHDSPVLEVKRLSKMIATQRNNTDEQEEAL